jgi:hypothetical protein
MSPLAVGIESSPARARTSSQDSACGDSRKRVPVLPNLECNGLAALDTQNIRDFPATQPRIAREVVGSKGTIEGLSLRASLVKMAP